MQQYVDLTAEGEGAGKVFRAFRLQSFFELEIEIDAGEYLRCYGGNCGTDDAEGKEAYQKQI